MVRKHIYFYGRVQGVGFRYRAYYMAQPLNLTGWVKNLWDDRVEMEVRGRVSYCKLIGGIHDYERNGVVL